MTQTYHVHLFLLPLHYLLCRGVCEVSFLVYVCSKPSKGYGGVATGAATRGLRHLLVVEYKTPRLRK